jgi:hypothetical protein
MAPVISNASICMCIAQLECQDNAKRIRIPKNPFIVNPRIVSKGSKVQSLSAFLAPCSFWDELFWRAVFDEDGGMRTEYRELIKKRY